MNLPWNKPMLNDLKQASDKLTALYEELRNVVNSLEQENALVNQMKQFHILKILDVMSARANSLVKKLERVIQDNQPCIYMFEVSRQNNGDFIEILWNNWLAGLNTVNSQLNSIISVIKSGTLSGNWNTLVPTLYGYLLKLKQHTRNILSEIVSCEELEYSSLKEAFLSNHEEYMNLIEKQNQHIDDIVLELEEKKRYIFDMHREVLDIKETSEEELKEIQKLLGIAANQVLTSDYEKKIEQLRKIARWWLDGLIVMILIFILLVVGWAISAVISIESCGGFGLIYHSSSSLMVWGVRTITLFSIGVIIYLINHHYSVIKQRIAIYESISLALTALNGYLSDLSEEARTRIKEELAYHMFSLDHYKNSKNKDTSNSQVISQVNELLSVIKKLSNNNPN